MNIYTVIERLFDGTTDIYTYTTKEKAKAKFDYIVDEYVEGFNIQDDDEDMEKENDFFSYYERHSGYCEVMIKHSILDNNNDPILDYNNNN